MITWIITTWQDHVIVDTCYDDERKPTRITGDKLQTSKRKQQLLHQSKLWFSILIEEFAKMEISETRKDGRKSDWSETISTKSKEKLQHSLKLDIRDLRTEEKSYFRIMDGLHSNEMGWGIQNRGLTLFANCSFQSFLKWHNVLQNPKPANPSRPFWIRRIKSRNVYRGLEITKISSVQDIGQAHFDCLQ